MVVKDQTNKTVVTVAEADGQEKKMKALGEHPVGARRECS
jgi:hypothetical protein